MVLILCCVCTDLSTDSKFALYRQMLGFFITEVEGVYCAARNESLYKTDYVSSLKPYFR
jgi:hypothetical protein